MVELLGARRCIYICAAGLVLSAAGSRPRIDEEVGSVTFHDQSVAEADPEAKAKNFLKNIARRPHYDTGMFEEVGFSIAIRSIFGLRLSDNTFVTDVVLTFQWDDPRTVHFLSEHQKADKSRDHWLVLSESDAKKRIWMPEMTVANRALISPQSISTAIQIHSNGTVIKIQRLLVSIKNKYDITHYPYDNQTLRIVVSSGRYMSNDVKLKDLGTSHVMEHAIDGTSFTLSSTNVQVYDETGTGAFHKSRGALQIEVTREPDYWVAPKRSALLLTTCGYLVFWMPMSTAFVMPRLSLSVISLLSIMSMRNAYLSTLAGTFGKTQGEVFFASCTLVLFIGICINITVEFVYYELKMPSLAERLHLEIKVLFPIIFLSNMLQCFSSSEKPGWESTIILYACFVLRCYIGVRSNRDKEAAAEPAGAKAESTKANTEATATTNTGADESTSSKP